MRLLTRTLGSTGVSVRKIGFGAAEIGGPPLADSIPDETAGRLLNRVLDLGIDFIDTSLDYGRSEELIGRFLATRRAEFFLATKCGCVPDDPDRGHLHTAANIRAGVETSLRRLRTDTIDLIQFHLSLSIQEMQESGALEELLKLKREGKARFIGISGTLPLLYEHAKLGTFDVFQVPYSALERDHESVITHLRQAGAGTVVRGGVSRGGPTDWDSRVNFRVAGDVARHRWEGARLDDLLDGMSRMEFMLRFTLSHADIDTAVIGTKDTSHLESNVEMALKGPLPDDMLAEAKRRLAAVGCSPAL